MDIDDVITDICSQVGDAGENTYATRAKYHLQQAVSELIRTKQYTLNEISPYVKKGTVALTVTGTDISNLKAIEILNLVPVFDAGYATDPWFIKFKDLNNIDLGGIYANKEQQPTNEDVWVIHYADKLEAIINTTASNFTSPTNVTIFYIEDIDVINLVDSHGSDDVETYFRISFIQRAKLIAIQTIKQEDELSN